METKCITFEMAGVVFRNRYNQSIHVDHKLTINHFLTDSEQKCDIENNVYFTDRIDFSQYTKEKPTMGTGVWSQYGNTIIFHPDGVYIAKMVANDDYSNVSIYMEKIDTSIHVLPICITGFLLQKYLLKKKKGFVMHGAAWRIQDVGCVFTGNSGVGKSTISGLIKESMVDAAQYSDDRYIMTIENDQIYAYGNPFDCKIERNINGGVKVDHLFFCIMGMKIKSVC